MASRGDIWPSAPIIISPRVKQLITRFFEISDSPEPTSGKLFADELFTKDGVFTTHKNLIFRGYEEIAASRERNSPAIASRSHQLIRVYAANSPANDLLVLGKFEIGLTDGNSVGFDFSARFITVTGQEGEERLQFVQVWTDPTDMREAFKKASERLAVEK